MKFTYRGITISFWEEDNFMMFSYTVGGVYSEYLSFPSSYAIYTVMIAKASIDKALDKKPSFVAPVYSVPEGFVDDFEDVF